MINHPNYKPSFLAGNFSKPVALFITDAVRKNPGKCLITETVDFMKELAGHTSLRYANLVNDPELYTGGYYNEKKLYYSYVEPEKEIYGKPDLFFNSGPYMAVYYCEHRDLREHQLNKATAKEVNNTNNIAKDETVFLAEGLLLLQSAIYYCKKINGDCKTLFCLACNKSILDMVEEYIINPAATYPVLEIPDITDLYFVQNFLAANGFTEMPLSDTHLRAEILGKIIVEADDTVLLYLGFE